MKSNKSKFTLNIWPVYGFLHSTSQTFCSHFVFKKGELARSITKIFVDFQLFWVLLILVKGSYGLMHKRIG